MSGNWTAQYGAWTVGVVQVEGRNLGSGAPIYKQTEGDQFTVIEFKSLSAGFAMQLTEANGAVTISSDVRSIDHMEIDDNGHLLVFYTNSTMEDLGQIAESRLFAAVNATLGPVLSAGAMTRSTPVGPASFEVWIDSTDLTTSPYADSLIGAGGENLHSIWYKWTPDYSGPTSFATVGSVVEDTQIYLFTGPDAETPADLTQVDLNDDIDGRAFLFQSQLTYSVTAGTTYWIEVNGYDSSEFGYVRLTGHVDDGAYLVNQANGVSPSFDGTPYPTTRLLGLNYGSLTSFDGAGLAALEALDLSGQSGPLTRVDVSANPNLVWLSVTDNNALAGLDLSHNPRLAVLLNQNTAITSLDLTANTELRYLGIAGSNVESLTFSTAPLLETLDASNSQLATVVNLTGLAGLRVFDASHSQLTSADLAGLTHLQVFDASYTHLTSLDLTNCATIEKVYVFQNPSLTTITLPASLPNLTEFTPYYCENLTGALDLSIAPNLTRLDAEVTGLSSIDVHDTAIQQFTVQSNPALTSVNLTGCANLADVLCINTPVASLDLTGCTSVQSLRIYENANLTTVIPPSSPHQLYFVQVFNTKLDQASVDALLAACVAGGGASPTGDGVFDATGTHMAAPSAAGLANKATLQSRNWTVTTN